MECLEMFSRRGKTGDFDVWGNEIPSHFQEATHPRQVNLVY